ncbi:hypothetical protein SAMN06265338_11747 [Rhodoblastus acidophilus]|uniref:DUF1476 family protein n=1 Tax=Rhodoblastus acidophilus TaxID=1074 RepID=A0A212S9V9_RHOAC|nr:DUF1476 domain-containing protein [Rhodoblastus acidophilus]PPQ36298.1 DUF1476 domain-containing protein [Rhodoblastus acidophilus]RAI20428.1 DUF1476 domain-containing protein [Rhodoblastus acidophilus]SNB82046.1 hypothetical protein SAMN06265338_11747 [Rhodoblastus acidophilus]
MNSLSDRAKAHEAEFKHREEMEFRVTARRNRLFGLWAASVQGLSGEAADSYALLVIAADFQAPGDEDVIAKVRADLAGKASDAEVRAELDRAAAEARRQLAAS